ncbi:MAG: hypothetical protein AAF986_08990 [Pseudomonadota bacterium]
MYTCDLIDLPGTVRARLKERASFAEGFAAFSREHVAGFRQPVAAASAFIFPVLLAFTYLVSDLVSTLETLTIFTMTTALFLFGAWYTNRGRIREDYQHRTLARRRARADLKLGQGQRMSLQLQSPPVFYEHEQGVIILAEAGEAKTLFFNVDGNGHDPRWFLYLNGDMHRNDWNWIRLGGSGDVMEFKATGRRLIGFGDPPYVDAPDAWEAVSLALGEPQDGDVVGMALNEAQLTVGRLL